MLGKLFRNEFKNTYKPVMIIFLSLLILTVVNCIAAAFNSTRLGDTLSFKIFSGTFNTMYVISMLIMGIAVIAVLCVAFYKSMYSSQGYLTHTLPVKPVVTFTVKLTVSLIWMMLSGIVMLISLFLFICAQSGVNPFTALAEFFEVLPEGYAHFKVICLEELGIRAGLLIFELIAAIVISILGTFLFIYTSLTIGQLSSQHKVGMSVVAGVALYLVRQIVSSVMFVSTFFRVSDFYDTSSKVFDAGVNDVIVNGILVSLAIVVIEYVADVFIVNKHINLQ